MARAILALYLTILFVGLLLAPAHAWEFNMDGCFNWSDLWVSQQGSQGFFGNYNVDAANLGTDNMNSWNGCQFDHSFSSGSNTAMSLVNMIFNTEIKVNRAIRMFGMYRLNRWNNPIDVAYITETAPGVHNAWTEGQWDTFWITANTPLGVFAVGKRPWTFGIALQYDGADNLSTESIALSSFYGPFIIGISFYPFRYAGPSAIPDYNAPTRVSTPIGDPYNLPTNSNYYGHHDRSGAFSNDFLVYLTCENGPFSAGVLASYGSYHVGPESQLKLAGANGSTVIPLDADLFHGTVYEKYNNGRFYLNTELAWLYWTDRFGADLQHGNGFMPPPQPGYPMFPSLPQTRYVEQLRAAIETGLLFGPAKLTLFGFWSPGPDRRQGKYIDRQPAAFVRHPWYDQRLSNYSLVMPYTYLVGFNYGSGLNAYNYPGDGYLRDAFALAARLDYAVATNLNIFGSFFWAERTSDGYERGCLRPYAATTSSPSSGNLDFTRVMPGPYMSNNYLTPNITERSLGYEVDVGLTWKLLEGLQFSMVAAYWAPGEWFSYACVDRSDPAWNDNNTPTGGAHARSIDAVVGGRYWITSKF